MLSPEGPPVKRWTSSSTTRLRARSRGSISSQAAVGHLCKATQQHVDPKVLAEPHMQEEPGIPGRTPSSRLLDRAYRGGTWWASAACWPSSTIGAGGRQRRRRGAAARPPRGEGLRGSGDGGGRFRGRLLRAARTIRELVARLEARSAEAADARARLELAERAQSALRGELEGEREERRRMGEEAGRLREELEAERSKGFWRRVFGG
jgi:hypothetical protein